jgi:uncharacterized protein (TIGR00290 family)
MAVGIARMDLKKFLTRGQTVLNRQTPFYFIMKKRITISWSGGKDSAFALFKILLSGEYEVVSLHTTINAETKRVGLHGVRETLIEQQSASIGIPLIKLYLPSSQTNDAYESVMRDFYGKCSRSGINAVGFGDINLVDLKVYREKLLKSFRLEGIYPLWNLETSTIIGDVINSGFRTTVCSADGKFFDETVLGKTIDENFIKTLPHGVDPCGENGEFHTFVYNGPIFKHEVAFEKGKIVRREYEVKKLTADGSEEKYAIPFWFIDLLSSSDTPQAI